MFRSPRSRVAPIGRWRITWRLLASVSLLAGCGGPAVETALRPHHRFIDDQNPRGPITTFHSVATLEDDTRHVLRAPPRFTLVWPEKLEDPGDDRVLVRSPVVPGRYQKAPSVLALPRVRVGNDWYQLPPRVIPTRRRGREARVDLEMTLPDNPTRSRLVVMAPAFAIGAVDLERIDSPPVAVPAGAVLSFAIGLVQPEQGHDPVEFTLQACDGGRCQALFSEVLDPRADAGAGWRDREVDLGALVGETRSFRFLARRVAEQAAFSFPVWANPTLVAPGPVDPDRSNVILLSIDTLRADHLSSYGYRHDTSPFIDERFGDGGTVFEHLVSAATVTTPSHASMMTALSPATHGTIHGMKALPEKIPTLAELARQAGLDTAAFTEDGWLGVNHGFNRGFDRFVENKSPDIMSPVGQVDATFAQAADWLRGHRDRRFFLFLHTFQVHTPYSPPKRYANLFGSDADGPIDESSPSHVRWMADYDREIRYTDDELRRLFETIDELGLGRSTVFVLTSDHGEAFLEHGILEHGTRLDQEVVHVPLLLWGRGIPAGRRVAAPVGHVDLMPTILEFLGVPAPSGIEGRSLAGLIRGEGGELGFAVRPLYSESRNTIELGPERSLRPFLPPAFLVRVGDRKLARYRTEDGVRYELYDLSSDPQERRDLYPGREEEARDLVELVDSYEERSRELRRRIDRGEASPQPEVVLDPEQEEKLRALGYLE